MLDRILNYTIAILCIAFWTFPVGAVAYSYFLGPMMGHTGGAMIASGIIGAACGYKIVQFSYR